MIQYTTARFRCFLRTLMFCLVRVTPPLFTIASLKLHVSHYLIFDVYLVVFVFLVLDAVTL